MASSPSPPPTPGEDVPVSALSRGRLIDVLTDTVGDLERLELPLTVEGIDEARRLRSSLIGQVRDHVLPRLADAAASETRTTNQLANQSASRPTSQSVNQSGDQSRRQSWSR